jgi:hypothetical protein
MSTTIIGVKLEDRLECSVKFQKIITEFGCNIRTRIGLHTSYTGMCSNYGIVLLEVCGEAKFLKHELSKHWSIQTMEFNC